MKVWIVMSELCHDFCEVIGVYDNEAAALNHKAQCPDTEDIRYHVVYQWVVASETDLEQQQVEVE